MRDRSGYISAGDYLIPVMKAVSDPRLSFFYSQVEGDYAPRVSGLSADGYGADDFDTPIVTCAENAFILAEALLQTGNESGARAAAKDGLACQEERWEVSLAAHAGTLDLLSGANLFTAVMLHKYGALFLNTEIWNDYKRTCLPAVTPRTAAGVPGRLYYGADERRTNPNIPPPAQQPARNDNDPNRC